MKDEVRNCLAELREKAGVTQEELANAVGVTRQSIISIERENCVPGVLLALKLAKFFKKPVENIFTLE